MKKEINKNYLKEQQYKTTKYLEARIKIHTFTENKKSFHQWLYEKYNFNNKLKDNLKILDVACGTGVFETKFEEAKNLNYDLIMTDFAESMLDKSKKNLSDVELKQSLKLQM